MKKVYIKTSTINLDQFLKWSGAVSTGGEAKILIVEGRVKVNGQVETHRSKKLSSGDIVELDGRIFEVAGGRED
ncbi:MAG TPA: RNA-binding S4 domain-containing protein [Thermoanaerobacterales bacterium]|nr:RNA-binding S4 domain-containing protein [Thermoanaerobacterales bacterium]